MSTRTDLYSTRRYEVDRIEAALCIAAAATERLRTFLTPGISDSVASMLLSDVQQATARVEWIRERLNEAAGGRHA